MELAVLASSAIPCCSIVQIAVLARCYLPYISEFVMNFNDIYLSNTLDKKRSLSEKRKSNWFWPRIKAALRFSTHGALLCQKTENNRITDVVLTLTGNHDWLPSTLRGLQGNYVLKSYMNIPIRSYNWLFIPLWQAVVGPRVNRQFCNIKSLSWKTKIKQERHKLYVAMLQTQLFLKFIIKWS